MKDTPKCKHPACTCVPPKGQDYCSVPCEDAKDSTELTCQCGHADCKGSALKVA